MLDCPNESSMQCTDVCLKMVPNVPSKTHRREKELDELKSEKTSLRKFVKQNLPFFHKKPR